MRISRFSRPLACGLLIALVAGGCQSEPPADNAPADNAMEASAGSTATSNDSEQPQPPSKAESEPPLEPDEVEEILQKIPGSRAEELALLVGVRDERCLIDHIDGVRRVVVGRGGVAVAHLDVDAANARYLEAEGYGVCASDVGDVDCGLDAICIEVKGGKAAESASDGQIEKWLIETAIERGHAYAEAGANGLFVPGLIDESLIATICTDSPLPVNIMAMPGVPSAARLAALGVARISHGPSPYRMAMDALAAAAKAAHEGG